MPTSKDSAKIRSKLLINFIDPGLNEDAGHHYAHASIIINELNRQGHQVILYCHRSINPHVRSRLDEISKVVPVFDSFPYPRYHGEIIDYDQQTSSLVKEYAAIGPADIWFFPSLFPFQLKALSSVDGPIKVFGCLHSFFDDDRWEEAVVAADRHDLHLASFESVITGGVSRYSTKAKFSVLPVIEYCEAIPLAKKNLKKVGFFGCQKAVKGQGLIEDIIVNLLNRGCEVVLQDAWDRFKIHREGVTNLGFVDSLPKVMILCDLLIFPYDVAEYSRRMSSVLNYALYLGIPCIVPQGTTLADRVPVDECRAAETSVDAIIETFDQMSVNFSSVAEKFYLHARSMDQDNIKNFVESSLR